MCPLDRTRCRILIRLVEPPGRAQWKAFKSTLRKALASTLQPGSTAYGVGDGWSERLELDEDPKHP